MPTREIIHASAPKEDFVDPRVWGAGAWGFIHSFAWAAPHEMARDDVQEYERTLRHVGANLPCSSCREHFRRLLQKDLPIRYPDIHGRDGLFRWSYDAHKMVNDRIGQKTPPFEEVRRQFEDISEDIRQNKGCHKGKGCKVNIENNPNNTTTDETTKGVVIEGNKVRTSTDAFAAIVGIAVVAVVAAAVAIGVAIGETSKPKRR